MNRHIETLLARRSELSGCAGDIKSAVETLCTSYRHGGKLLLCGNGGSAADCEHWAGELLKSFILPRPLSGSDREDLPDELGNHLQQGLAAIPLTGFISASTAFNNDVSAEYSFAQLVWSLGTCGDILVAMSTSGNSKNILHAVEAAKARQVITIGFTGQNGGKLAKLADICICVPESETYKIQELHVSIYHTICMMLEQEFFGE